MSEYDVLVSRIGQAAVDRLVKEGLFDEGTADVPTRETCSLTALRPSTPAVGGLLEIETSDGTLFRSSPTASGGLPHAIPYQGSKRSLAPLIARYVPSEIDRWYEPFAGSAAMTIWAASQGIAKQYIISDALLPLVELWRSIIDHPNQTALQYTEVWNGQRPNNPEYFYSIRSRYNADRNPVDLLYLICRCVKNAVRFNRQGSFTQSVDKRRLGMRPEKMEVAMSGISRILQGKVDIRQGDWLQTTCDASSRDFVYMDPPYFGTTVGRDKRYAEQLQSERLIVGLSQLVSRRIRFILSYDGMTGDKIYAEPLPAELGLTQLLIHAGKSSQATLAGRSEDTVESLYLSPGLGHAIEQVVRKVPFQPSFDLARAS